MATPSSTSRSQTNTWAFRTENSHITKSNLSSPVSKNQVATRLGQSSHQCHSMKTLEQSRPLHTSDDEDDIFDLSELTNRKSKMQREAARLDGIIKSSKKKSASFLHDKENRSLRNSPQLPLKHLPADDSPQDDSSDIQPQIFERNVNHQTLQRKRGKSLQIEQESTDLKELYAQIEEEKSRQNKAKRIRGSPETSPAPNPPSSNIPTIRRTSPQTKALKSLASPGPSIGEPLSNVSGHRRPFGDLHVSPVTRPLSRVDTSDLSPSSPPETSIKPNSDVPRPKMSIGFETIHSQEVQRSPRRVLKRRQPTEDLKLSPSSNPSQSPETLPHNPLVTSTSPTPPKPAATESNSPEWLSMREQTKLNEGEQPRRTKSYTRQSARTGRKNRRLLVRNRDDSKIAGNDSFSSSHTADKKLVEQKVFHSASSPHATHSPTITRTLNSPHNSHNPLLRQSSRDSVTSCASSLLAHLSMSSHDTDNTFTTSDSDREIPVMEPMRNADSNSLDHHDPSRDPSHRLCSACGHPACCVQARFCCICAHPLS
ncbi:hypothetical protein BLNAU_22599 [Blattamonas nauphoetae]|uniref:Uncharacterized protein n=1 Tax=Blattamonas nauphoetae TaxID=2049346 RepID=A0ABQ9WSM0_9EUKA|nr:hypothetical protein BLNAU_22599 [Blattamonas nauphoetae]